MFGMARIALAALTVLASATGEWSGPLADGCPRCVASALLKPAAPTALPPHAIVYSITGEFASEAHWWTIDLDTGEVFLSRITSNGKTTARVLVLDKTRLGRLRTAALWTWRARPVMPSSSTAEVYTFVISGERMAYYDPFGRGDMFISQEVKDAICGGVTC